MSTRKFTVVAEWPVSVAEFGRETRDIVESFHAGKIDAYAHARHLLNRHPEIEELRIWDPNKGNWIWMKERD